MTVLHDAWFAVYHWVWVNGVPGNLAASGVLWFGAGVIVDRGWRKHIAPHLRRAEENDRMTREVHELLHHLHPDEARALGHAVPTVAQQGGPGQTS